jgi:hypothetical protein
MRPSNVAEIAEGLGISEDEVTLVREYSEEFKQWLKARKKAQRRSAKAEKEGITSFAEAAQTTHAIPEWVAHNDDEDGPLETGVSSNPERRLERLEAQLNEARAEEPAKAMRSRTRIATQLRSKDPQVKYFLFQQYQGRCQVTGFTFTQRSGEPYFEAIRLAHHQYAEWFDRPGAALCLSPNIAAQFQFGTFDINNFLEQVRSVDTNYEQEIYTFKITLCGQQYDLHYTQKHLIELHAILNVDERQNS